MPAEDDLEAALQQFCLIATDFGSEIALNMQFPFVEEQVRCTLWRETQLNYGATELVL